MSKNWNFESKGSNLAALIIALHQKLKMQRILVPDEKTKNKCGIKVVAVERIKYKLVPVEVPRFNYLPDKQLTNKELKNAWKVFEHSSIKNQLENMIIPNNQINEENPNYNNGLIVNPNLTPPQHHQINVAMNPNPPIVSQVLPTDLKHGKKSSKHASLIMQPSVVYVKRYDFSTDQESDKNSYINKDYFVQKDNFKEPITKRHEKPKFKIKKSLKKKITKKFFYDYD